MLRVFSVFALLPSFAVAAPDVLVVCPVEYREALEPWVVHRTAQGHTLALVGPSRSVDEMHRVVRAAADSGRLRYVLLVGDAPTVARQPTDPMDKYSVPTHYVQATVNVRWGSPPHIATDSPLADVDGDGRPDLAVGRIPVDSAAELENVVRKIIRYEQFVASAEANNRINIVAGMGGFGPTIDRVIETAARKLISDHLPNDCAARLAQANPLSQDFPGPQRFRANLRGQLTQSSRAWIYFGHGHIDALDALATEDGPQPMLAAADLVAEPLESPSTGNPLAVLMACYTGAFDAPTDCLAEELLIQPGGPVAVLAATRVSMPYGNTVLGYELLKASFVEEFDTLGATFLAAQLRTMNEAPNDTTRMSLDQIARGLMPAPVDLSAERREHAQMYHLLGDPMLRVRAGLSEVRIAEMPDERVAR